MPPVDNFQKGPDGVILWGKLKYKKYSQGVQGNFYDLDILRHPLESLTVSLPHDDRAHEDLDGPDTFEGDLPFAGGLVQAQLVPQLFLGDGHVVVDLVTKDEEGDLVKVLHGQKGVEFGFGLGHALVVLRVDEEDDAGDFGEVVLPQPASLLMTTEIERCEAAVTDGKLLGSRMQRGLKDGNSVILQHVEQRRLPCVVQTQEQQLRVLVHEAQRGEDIPEPV